MDNIQQLLEVSGRTLATYRATNDAATDSDGNAVAAGAKPGMVNGRMVGVEEHMKQLETQLEEKKTDVHRVW